MLLLRQDNWSHLEQSSSFYFVVVEKHDAALNRGETVLHPRGGSAAAARAVRLLTASELSGDLKLDHDVQLLMMPSSPVISLFKPPFLCLTSPATPLSRDSEGPLRPPQLILEAA